MSINKGYIEELYKQGFTYQEIATQAGVSRQRIHQIVKGYKNFGRKDREEHYRDLGICEECKKENAILLHHKDFNNEHDEVGNLERLCYGCHVRKHASKKNKIYKELSEDEKNKITKDYAVYDTTALAVNKITEKHNISKSTLYRILKEQKN